MKVDTIANTNSCLYGCRYLSWEQVQHCYNHIAVTVIPLLAGPLYNEKTDEEPLSKAPIATTATDVLQQCSLIVGPKKYIDILQAASRASGVGSTSWQRMEVPFQSL